MDRGAHKESGNGRIVFLDHLRGLAVLLVVWGHIFMIGINGFHEMVPWMPNLQGPLFGSEAPTTNIHGLIGLFLVLKFGISAGGLGVAVFFVISGFVILKTIDAINPADFLVRRFFRIVPLNAFVCICISLLLFAYCRLENIPAPSSLKSVIVSSFAANYYFESFTILPVLWTLEAEIAFYLVIALVVTLFGRLGFLGLLGTSATCLVLITAANSPIVARWMAPQALALLSHLSVLLIHIAFMLVGAVIYRGVTSARPAVTTGYAVAALALCLTSYETFRYLSGGQHVGYHIPDILAALLIFTLALIAGLKGRWLSPLKFLGDISYPLYLVHIPLGWWLLAASAHVGFGMYVSACLSASACILVSWILHVWVETPTQRLGRRFSFKKRASYQAAAGAEMPASNASPS
jgi:peptidoglycan/LPS O-acetylase OafA/YrhL